MNEQRSLRVLGIITARGGSKGIPRKNLADLGGKPLLAHTAAAARASQLLSRTVVSTDDAEIAEAGRAEGMEVPFMRPAALAADESRSIDVAAHAVGWLAENDAWIADIIVILQPTSPFRTTRHIDEALALMLERSADTVVSVQEVPHQFGPSSVMEERDGWLHHFLPSESHVRRQDKPRFWARNGPAVLACTTAVMEQGSFYGNHVVGYPMDRLASVDIDEQFDLEWARHLLATRL